MRLRDLKEPGFELELPDSKILNEDLRCESDRVKTASACPVSQHTRHGDAERGQTVRTKTDSTGLLEKLTTARYYPKSNTLLGTVHSLLNEIHI